ncbi:hypothetical protein BpHYR1_019061, partial [Brachionus plicatilis]
FILTYYFQYVTNSKNFGDECKADKTTLETTSNSENFETTARTLNLINTNSDKIIEEVSTLFDIQEFTYFAETKKSLMDVTSKERTEQSISQHLTTVFEEKFYETSSKTLFTIFNQVTEKAETSSGLITLNQLVTSVQPGQIGAKCINYTYCNGIVNGTLAQYTTMDCINGFCQCKDPYTDIAYNPYRCVFPNGNGNYSCRENIQCSDKCNSNGNNDGKCVSNSIQG